MMKTLSLISREQDYALRMTAYLAGLEKEKFISIPSLAEKLYISQNFASRIVHKLKKASITGALQGKYGGIYLKADPKTLSVYDVLSAIGFKVKFNDCLRANFSCELSFGCKFHYFFAIEEKAFIDKLKEQMVWDYIIKIKDKH